MAPPSKKRAANSQSRGGWLVNVADDEVAPMTTLEVIDGLRSGRLTEQTLVWRTGMHAWTAAVDVPQLRLAAGSRPPPAAPAAAPASEEAIESAPFTPVAAVATPLTLEAEPSPGSLAPTTTEAEATVDLADLDALLSSERRADQRSSRRAVLGAALGSAALAAVFTLFVLRSRASHDAEPAAQPSPLPAPVSVPSPTPSATPVLETTAAPSASVLAAPRSASSQHAISAEPSARP